MFGLTGCLGSEELGICAGMAAVIIAALKRTRGRQDPVTAADDAEGGGLQRKGQHDGWDVRTAVSAEKMLEVLTLEKDMIRASVKFLPFCFCVSLFLVALCEFSPTANLQNVHRHLIAHFGLAGLSAITDFNGVYVYMEAFARQNAEMQATSYKYWCERRYAVHQWDEHSGVPVHRCPSPRLTSLELIPGTSYSWRTLNGFGSSSSSSSSGSSSSSSSHGRRISSSSSSSGGSSGHAGGEHATQPVPPCQDHLAELRMEISEPNMTCLEAAVDAHHHVCDNNLGVTLCPMTCGYCALFTYDHMRKFEKPQVTMLPIMVHQTRFKAAACHDFAHTYNTQPYNPTLTLLPTLDGPRNEEVLSCFDRSGHQDDQYALLLECTPDTPASHCIDNKVPITQKHTYHGDIIYPKMLLEPHHDVAVMKAVEWIDVQSEAVTVSTVVYTEDLEIFTSLSVVFQMDEAGNVDGSYTMISYRDMVLGSKSAFIGCLITCAICSFFCFAFSVYYMYRYTGECNLGYQLYEIISWGMLFLYPLILLISWSNQIPMSEEYDHLLHSFLDATSLEHHAIEDVIQSYFDAKTHIYGETTWLQRHRMVSYFVCYIQFLQLILYFNAHPRLAVLTTTVAKAMNNIMHFLALFGVLFILLAFMAHWMLGPDIPEFGTFGTTLESMMRMTFGAFLKAGKVDDMGDSQTAMYWLFALTFMVLIWLTLLNFFLAIIVDAFVEVKDDNKDIVARGFFVDFRQLFWTWFLSKSGNWPPRQDLIAFFESVADDAEGSLSQANRKEAFMEKVPSSASDSSMAPVCGIEDIAQAFPSLDKMELMRFLLHYKDKCEDIFCNLKVDEDEAALEQASYERNTVLREATSSPARVPSPISPSTPFTDAGQLPGRFSEEDLGMQWY